MPTLQPNIRRIPMPHDLTQTSPLELGKALHLLLLITSSTHDKIIDKHRKEASQLIHNNSNALNLYLEYTREPK